MTFYFQICFQFPKLLVYQRARICAFFLADDDSGLFGIMEGRLFQGAGVGTLLSGPKQIDLFLDWF